MAANSVPFIRPLSLAELLDQAIGLYRRNFLTFIGIIAIPYIPLGIIQSLSAYLSTSSALGERFGSLEALLSNTTYWLGIGGTALTGILYLILVNGVATAALTRAVADNYTGQPVSILAAYRKIGTAWFRLLLALALVLLIDLALFVWLIVPCVGWLTGPGMLFFTVAVVTPFVAPVVMLEKLGGLRAIRRAWDLARSRFWWLVGFTGVLVLFSWFIIQGPAYLIQFVMTTVLGSRADFQQQMLLTTIVQYAVVIIASLLYMPLNLAAIIVVYFDLRVRSEGLDLALQAAGQSNESVNIVSLAETSSPPQPSLITGTDVTYFLLLTLVFGAFYALVSSLLVGGVMALAGLR